MRSHGFGITAISYLRSRYRPSLWRMLNGRRKIIIIPSNNSPGSISHFLTDSVSNDVYRQNIIRLTISMALSMEATRYTDLFMGISGARRVYLIKPATSIRRLYKYCRLSPHAHTPSEKELASLIRVLTVRKSYYTGNNEDKDPVW